MWEILSNLDSAPGAVMGYIAYWIIWLIATIAGFLIAIITYLISVILQLSGSITQLFAVQQGYAITLSLANLGFVLAIIVVAIATILKREPYGIKKTLWRLIVAAILVNFSLVIGGAILNFANALTFEFLKGFGGSPASFGDELAGAFTPQRNLINNFLASSTPPTAGGAAEATLAPIFGIVLASFSIIAIVITLVALLIMLLVRYVYLAFLLIVMPFAWLAWTFESTKSNFGKWWNTFFRWSFFAPVVVFFLSLVIATAKAMNHATENDPLAVLSGTQYQPNADTNPILAAISKFFGDFVGGFAGSLLQSVLLVGLSVGGMMAANKLSITGASAAIDTMKSARDAVKGYAGRKTKNIVGERLRTAGRQYNPTTTETTTTLQRIGSRLQNVPVPGAGKLGSIIAKQGTESSHRNEAIESFRKENLTSLTKEGVIARATSSTAFVDPIEAAAIAQELARRNLTSDPKVAPLVPRFVKAAEQMGTIQTILNNRPDLAAQTIASTPRFDAALARMETAAEAQTRAIGEAVRKIKVADIISLDYRTLGDTTIALNISNQHLGKLGSEGSLEQMATLRATIQNLLAAATAPGGSPLPAAQRDALDRIVDYMNSSPNWQNI